MPLLGNQTYHLAHEPLSQAFFKFYPIKKHSSITTSDQVPIGVFFMLPNYTNPMLKKSYSLLSINA
ncbi:MAG: hypothetical protein CBB92_13575 [Flammeovirgaceae bacterium TMED32]|nr:MAG: hypothetical protein CBB92_13575 [Flammeovirgaceae bacterium TMED32]